MESLPTSPEVTYNWVDITSEFFKNIQGNTYHGLKNDLRNKHTYI